MPHSVMPISGIKAGFIAASEASRLDLHRLVVLDYVKVVMKTFIIITHVPLLTLSMRFDWLFPFWIDQAVPFFWMISAYLFTRAFERHGSHSAMDELRWNRLGPRLARVFKAYLPIFVLIAVVAMRRTGLSTAVNSLLGVNWFGTGSLGQAAAFVVGFFAGGFGPGGYYIPCLLQMYLVLPFMAAYYRRDSVPTTVVVIIFAAVGELSASMGVVSIEVWRLIVVRYLPHFLIGTVLAQWSIDSRGLADRRRVAQLSAMLAIGLAYLIAVCRLGAPALSTEALKSTSSFTCLYAGGAFGLIMAADQVFRKHVSASRDLSSEGHSHLRLTPTVQLLSRAALHVYIFQMLWYYYMANHIAFLEELGLLAATALCLVVCMGFGVIHYLIESVVTTCLRKAS